MRGGARSLALLLLGCSLLTAACQPQTQTPPQPAAAPAPPQRGLTICDRPPKPAATPADPKVEASFRAFARTWVGKMGKAGAAKGAAGGRKRIRDEFETELRPTGSKQAPWVGLLRYCEETLRCTSASAASCQVSKSTAVTEIFRLEAGKWTY
jgi:hypothetical protein